MSFMRRHQENAISKKVNFSKSKVAGELHKVEYKKWKSKMMEDRTIIKSYPSFDDRNAKGAELLNGYLDYLRSWIKSGLTHQNDVLVQCVVWAADGERWDVLFELADAAISQPVNRRITWFPTNSGRELQDFVSDEIMKRAKDQGKAGDQITAPINELFDRIKTDQYPVNHIIKSRIRRFLGLEAMKAEEWSLAVELLEEADNLYKKIGVKGHLDTARKELAAATREKEQSHEENSTDSPLEERQSAEEKTK